MKEIANDDLKLEQIPDPDQGCDRWICLHSINGYTQDPLIKKENSIHLYRLHEH